MDGHTIGQLFKSVRGTVLVIGVTISCPGAPASRPIFLDAPSTGTDGRGAAELELIKATLQSHPWTLGLGSLQSRLAIAIGDGHFAAGEHSKHHPTEALRTLFQQCGRRARTSWSTFHKIDKAGVSACHKVPLVQSFSALLKDLESVFGGGQGRTLDKQVCQFLGIPFRIGRVPGTTRKIVYFSEGPAVYLRKFRSYYHAIQIRRLHAEEGRGVKPSTFFIELGQRLASARMLTFLMTFDQTLKIMRPWALAAQETNTTPWHIQSVLKDMIAKMQKQKQAISWLRGVLQVIQFLQPYVPGKDVANFLTALQVRIWRAGSTLGAAIPILWTTGRFCGMKVVLDADPAVPDSEEMIMHNSCQCAFRKGPPLNPQMPRPVHADPTSVLAPWRGLQAILDRRAGQEGEQPERLFRMASWVQPHGPLCGQASVTATRSPAELGHIVSRSALKQRPPHRGCVLNKFAAHTASEILHGLQSAEEFLSSFLEEVVPWCGCKTIQCRLPF